MRLLTLSAALVLLAAGPALAGDRGGGHGGGHGGHPPRPPVPCCGHGGGSTNVNVNVNASARAYANASAGSYINARTYDMGGLRGGFRGGGGSYGAVYVGGGYGGDVGYVGTPVYYDIDPRVLACASAPFGYTVGGFGRDIRGPARCGYRDVDYGYEDRGGRYGYSERHDSYEERSYESYESYEEYGAYEEHAAYEAYDDQGAWDGRHRYDVSEYDRGYMDGRRDCDCRPDGRDGTPYPPPYLPEPPRYEPPAPPPARPHRPHRPRHDAPPRQEYRQEPGERG